jgi:hypothetical protein
VEPLSARYDLNESLAAKEAYRTELARLPVEDKMAMVLRMIEVAGKAGTLPDWYYRLMNVTKPKTKPITGK